MLLHLSRKRLPAKIRRGEPLRYLDVELYVSGDAGHGDWFLSPVAVVIDVADRFVVSSDGTIVIPSRPSGQDEFWPETMFVGAKRGWFGLTLLWDEDNDDEA